MEVDWGPLLECRCGLGSHPSRGGRGARMWWLAVSEVVEFLAALCVRWRTDLLQPLRVDRARVAAVVASAHRLASSVPRPLSSHPEMVEVHRWWRDLWLPRQDPFACLARGPGGGPVVRADVAVLASLAVVPVPEADWALQVFTVQGAWWVSAVAAFYRAWKFSPPAEVVSWADWTVERRAGLVRRRFLAAWNLVHRK